MRDIPHSSENPELQALRQQNLALADEVAALRSEVSQMRSELRAGAWALSPRSLPWNLLSHSLVVLVLSLGAALGLAALAILDRELSKGGGQHVFFLYYIVPISAPFVAFLLDRAARMQRPNPLQWIIDLLVVILSFARALYDIPFFSGHALFLTYALLTTRSRVTRLLTLAVLVQVVYLKFFVWHDSTLYGGILLGILASGAFHLTDKKR